MYVTLPWFVALVFFAAFAFAWTVLDKSWLSGRIDDVEDRNDQRADAVNQRLERAEDWIKHLDERTRRQAGALPIDEPRITVNRTDDEPDPGTVPISLPDTQPHERVLIGHWADGMPKTADWVEPAIEALRARNAERLKARADLAQEKAR